tara:strand:- start:1975 stop:2694 length:720 start_codon:yes stop_codon:yes gene_type:complete
MVEALATDEIDPDQFTNPITQAIQRIFTTKGKLDGEVADDVVKTTRISSPAKTMLPSQSEIFLGKSLGMSVGGVRGGNLGAIVSKDNRILDGHHRWAATMFSDPKVKIGALRADLKIGDLVPVLRALGDAFGNTRRGKPASGDINIYDATLDDALEAIHDGKYMNPKFYNKANAIEWLESIGGEDVLRDRLEDIQSKTPPVGAPARSDMPVIDADKKQHVHAAGMLSKGRLDVRKPYAK